jgi:hypothetical protein
MNYLEEEGIFRQFFHSGQHQHNFNERMFIYFVRLSEKYRRKILPIAILSHDSKRTEPD